MHVKNAADMVTFITQEGGWEPKKVWWSLLIEKVLFENSFEKLFMEFRMNFLKAFTTKKQFRKY